MKIKKNNIPLYKTWITKKEKLYIKQAVESSWISSTGRYITDFEEAFAEYIGTKYAISTNNGTSACHLALLGARASNSSLVIVPSTTFIATANSATYCGAKIKFIDIDPYSWNMDLEKLEQIDNSQEKNVILFWVHLYGNIEDMDRVKNICKKKNIVLVEDACESLGGKWKNSKTGTFGETAAFSFYGNKTITTGEGGMVTTNNQDVAEKMKILRGQGQTDRYYHQYVGYNYRMTNIQAAIGLAQLERIHEIIGEKERVYSRYKNNLKGVVDFATENELSTHSKWVVAIKTKNKDRIVFELNKKGIDTRPIFIPLNMLPPYKDKKNNYPQSSKLYENGLVLPSYPQLSNNEIDIICSTIRSVNDN